MMNYLWAGLILLSLVFALGTDVNELRSNRYRNGVPLAVDARGHPTVATDDPTERVDVTIPDDAWDAYFRRRPGKAETTSIPATVVRDADGRAQLRLTVDELPVELADIRKFHDPSGKTLVATVAGSSPTFAADRATRVELTFEPVRFVRLRAINEAAVAFAQKAFEVAIGLVGGLTLWLGLLRIAEDAGLVNVLVRIIRPVIGPLFPGVPKESPALGLIAMNVAANMLALGNAATPIGIKAMQELQKLNPTKDTATNAMVMLLAINTAGVTLLPSPTLVGIMGPRIGVVMGPIIATTAVSLAIAIVVCKVFERFSRRPIAADESATPT